MKRLSANKLSFSYPRRHEIFRDLDLELVSDHGAGHVSALMGPSGCGKTTFLRLVLGLEEPSSGSIETFPEHPVISYVPQEPVLFEHLSPRENAEYFRLVRTPGFDFDGELFEEILAIIHLGEILGRARSVTQMSGGERQRLSLLRALSVRPEILLLDEPCTGMDADTKRGLLKELRQIVTLYDLLVVYVTHHKVEAELIADEIAYFEKYPHGAAVRSATQGGVCQFLETPPSLEVAKAFDFPSLSVLRCRIGAEGELEPAPETAKDEDSIHLAIHPDAFAVVKNHSGYSFRVRSKSPMYAVVHLEAFDSDVLLHSRALAFAPASLEAYSLLLLGKVLVYSREGRFLMEAHIKNNHLIA